MLTTGQRRLSNTRRNASLFQLHGFDGAHPVTAPKFGAAAGRNASFMRQGRPSTPDCRMNAAFRGQCPGAAASMAGLPAAECQLSLTQFPAWPKHGKAAFRAFAVSLGYITRSGGGWRRSQESPMHARCLSHDSPRRPASVWLMERGILALATAARAGWDMRRLRCWGCDPPPRRSCGAARAARALVQARSCCWA